MFVSIMVCPALLPQYFVWISLMAKGVQNEVTHIVSRMCVVRQSTVLIPCKHTSPSEQVRAAEWLYEKSPEQKVRVSQDPAFEGRVESVHPDAGNCSLLLRDVRKSDAGIFRFVLSTASGQNWTNSQGIQLEVTDAELEVKTESDVVMEGDLIMFACGSCIPSMTVPTYIWMKDGQLHSQLHGENILVLESVKLEDGGRYSCILRGHEGLRSTSVEVTVRPGYPPQSVSVSISPSGVIVEGDSVTLICSSDSNPPALIFRWFKENQSSSVGSGQSFIISSFSSSHSGRYSCEAQNQHGSQRSDSVSVAVEGTQRAALQTVTGTVAGLIFIIIIVIIIVFRRRKRQRECGTEDMNQKQTADSSDETYTALDPASRTSADIYSTIRSGDSRPPDDTYTALHLQSRLSDYENLAVTSADPH
ncbi:B-cell receptor CD22 isoform X11 [Carassius gibelio]|uniref:B-cell receptor CD22 isoform X10 n=1 Tax=Carassius gibelio TaxID=101364 RepID=UPI002277B170|nr:B-cell receptor CD22 isoform X10 [Carassius gibelio]XP_052461279.1 B-cell receptor CD22 isoform X11 [Carassius gibelio]